MVTTPRHLPSARKSCPSFKVHVPFTCLICSLSHRAARYTPRYHQAQSLLYLSHALQINVGISAPSKLSIHPHVLPYPTPKHFHLQHISRHFHSTQLDAPNEPPAIRRLLFPQFLPAASLYHAIYISTTTNSNPPSCNPTRVAVLHKKRAVLPALFLVLGTNARSTYQSERKEKRINNFPPRLEVLSRSCF